MKPVPLQDKNGADIVTNSTYEGCYDSDYKNYENVSTISKCAVLVKIVLVMLMCISISFNAVFLVSMIQGRLYDNSKCNTDVQVNEVCLGCRYFEDSDRYSIPKNILAYKRKRGKTKEAKDTCCFEYTDSLHEMSKIFLLEHMTSDSFSKNESQKRPAAHLTLEPQTISENGSRLRWNSVEKETNSVFTRHVLYADDKLVIQDAGAYYVYSFITFRSEHIKNETFLNHYVYKVAGKQGQTTNQAEMIFMDKQMRQRGNLEYQTSFLAGIVKLGSRDRIFTEVSDIKAVYRSSMSNYVGLFKL